MKSKIIILCVLLVIIAICCLRIIDSNAAYYSPNIEEIDDSKYPGYKEKLMELKKIYPNIQIFYTGLDWNTVISNERVHSRNLVPKSYSKDWICSECDTKLYDTGWYCASDEAVRYLMDPRLYLDVKNIFQFQKLDSNRGTLDTTAIWKSTLGSFLEDTDCVNAIYNAAKDNNINAFHLVTRTIQEQGRSGTSTLSSGAEYKGINGVIYKDLYNLFSIGASGNNPEVVKTNGLDRAMKEGWTSRASSITGGAKFLKDKYLNRKQNTLYLQKFDIDNNFDGLYWHQYMQNLLGAKNEANLMYEAYSKSNLIGNKNFEFIVPIYNNMPKELSPDPGTKYIGNINTDLQSIDVQKNSNGQYYLNGNIVVVEWIKQKDGTYKSSVPKSTVKMKMTSTDGTKTYDIYTSQVDGHIYYFDRNLTDIDTTKQYKISIELINANNMAQEDDKKMIVDFKKGIVKDLLRDTLSITNKLLAFTPRQYVGDMNSNIQNINLIKTDKGLHYITGDITIVEWIGGVSYVPTPLPKIKLKSTDGTISEDCYINQIEGHKYYFDKNLTNIDSNKEYYFELNCSSQKNISTNKNAKIYFPNTFLGKMENAEVKIENNILKIAGKEYWGNINSTVDNLKILTTTQDYISGNLTVVEWIKQSDGSYTSNVPKTCPTIMIKSTDGKFSKTCYIDQVSGHNYYFDTPISDLDITKEYYFELSLTNKENISNSKRMKLVLGARELKQLSRTNIVTTDSTLKWKEKEYKGNIQSKINTSNIIKNAKGENYISGNITVTEAINNITYNPDRLPVVTLKSTDNTFSQICYLDQIADNQYYFDKNIENIDKTKIYYLEISSGNKNNTSVNSKMKVILSNKDYGIIKDYQLLVQNSNLVFKYVGKNAYYGNINTQLDNISMTKTKSGLDYLFGEIIIVEWVKQANGNYLSTVPKDTPKIWLKSTDGFKEECYVNQIDGHRYYFDRNVNNIDNNRKYYLEAELITKDNIGVEKIKEIGFGSNRNIGETASIKASISNNKLVFSKNQYIGNINSQIVNITTTKNINNANYLMGEIIIVEWVKQPDGNYISTIPKGTPKIYLKSTDGYKQECYVNQIDGHRYYFDRNITNINKNKEYYLQIELNNSNNIGTNKTMQIIIKM